jgi:nitrite reductase (NADH) small subunit
MATNWVKVCKTDHIPLYAGISVLVFGRQVAIFHLKKEYYAISDYDPFSGSYVLSRGFVDDEGDVPRVSSPVYSQSFSLLIVDGAVYIAIPAERESRYTFQTISSKR